MKMKLCTTVLTVLTLSACSSPSVKLGKEGSKLSEISHLCIIKGKHTALEDAFQTAVQKQGISSEIVDIQTNRKRLYEEICRYNFRYSVHGKLEEAKMISTLIRTPEHPVASFRYSLNNGSLQQQADQIMAAYFQRKAK